MHILDGALVVHGNFVICDFGDSWITEQHILVRGPLCRKTQIMPRPCFSPCLSLSCCMGRGVYRHANLVWTSSAHGCGKYTENVIFRVFFFSFCHG